MPATDLDLDPVIDPLIRPKLVRRQSGQHSVVMAPKPAMAARDPEGLRRERMVAVAFGAVLDERGIANTTIADFWRCSEVIVRGVRCRNRPLSYAKILALPKDLRDAIERKADELLALADDLPSLPELLRSRPENDHFNR